MIDFKQCYMHLSKIHPSTELYGNDVFSEDKPILAWVNNMESIEAGAIKQLLDVAKLPFIFDHIAVMPDVHQGYGITIGGVVPCNGVIVPYFVGKDKGCGMRFVETNFLTRGLTDEMIIRIRRALRKKVPVGEGKAHQKMQDWDGFEKYLDEMRFPPTWYTGEKWMWFKRSLGTLGGGNHFLELQSTVTHDDKEHVGLMLHSGSRNLGSTVCDYHHNVAKEMCRKYHAKLPNEHCSFLPVDSPEGQDYINDMNFCLDYAKESRRRMMKAFKEVFADEVLQWLSDGEEGYLFQGELDVHHNYAALENHLGKNVWLHRKGAISAKPGELGIIPGSQGSHSYIVKGFGNVQSFMSCPHGAGRKFGRNQACKQLNLEEEIAKMKGIVFDSYGSLEIKGEKYPDLQEAEGAYKDIGEVMANTSDLCEVITKLRPLGSVKGHDRRSKGDR